MPVLGGDIMDYREYERAKKELKNLTPKEYEERIKEILKKIER